MSKLIKLNKKNNHLFEVIINRAEKLNAMTKPMWIELGKIFKKFIARIFLNQVSI